jgi:hypothetical protein
VIGTRAVCIYPCFVWHIVSNYPTLKSQLQYDGFPTLSITPPVNHRGVNMAGTTLLTISVGASARGYLLLQQGARKRKMPTLGETSTANLQGVRSHRTPVRGQTEAIPPLFLFQGECARTQQLLVLPSTAQQVSSHTPFRRHCKGLLVARNQARHLCHWISHLSISAPAA